MNIVHEQLPLLNPWESYLHAACLVLLDGLSYGASSRVRPPTAACTSDLVRAGDPNSKAKRQCLEYLLAQLPAAMRQCLNEHSFVHHGLIQTSSNGESTCQPSVDDDRQFGLPGCPFTIQKGPHGIPAEFDFALQAPTTAKNVMRVLRGLQLHKPILLEGSPGVGKTSLCLAIAKASGHRVVRINLSEQTDMMVPCALSSVTVGRQALMLFDLGSLGVGSAGGRGHRW